MILKFFKRGKSPVSYTTGNKSAEIIRGDIKAFLLYEHFCHYRQKTCTGGLFWSADDIVNDSNIISTINSFENAVTCNCSQIELITLWVKHSDKYFPLNEDRKRIELHFHIGEFNFVTRTKFQPNIDMVDRRFFSLWQEITNIEQGWTSPLDIACRQLTTMPPRCTASNPFRQEINDHLLEIFEAGLLRDRTDVVKHLLRMNYTIEKTFDDFLVVHKSGGKSFELRGLFFENVFNYAEVRHLLSEPKIEREARKKVELPILRKNYETEFTDRKFRFEKRYFSMRSKKAAVLSLYTEPKSDNHGNNLIFERNFDKKPELQKNNSEIKIKKNKSVLQFCQLIQRYSRFLTSLKSKDKRRIKISAAINESEFHEHKNAKNKTPEAQRDASILATAAEFRKIKSAISRLRFPIKPLKIEIQERERKIIGAIERESFLFCEKIQRIGVAVKTYSKLPPNQDLMRER